MIYVRSLGGGNHLVGINTSLGVLVLLLRDDASLGNLYIYLRKALLKRLTDDLLTMVATGPARVMR